MNSKIPNGTREHISRPTFKFSPLFFNKSISLSGGGGSGASASVSLAPAAVGGFTITNGGSGYTEAPTVTIEGGGGSGATATASIAPYVQTITWDVENRPVTITGGATFVYDGDGNRVKKTEGGQTILYINKYYEKNLTTGVITTNYYLGDRLIAERQNTTLQYVHQDALTGTSLTTNASGTSTGSIKYFSFGQTRSDSVREGTSSCSSLFGVIPGFPIKLGMRFDGRRKGTGFPTVSRMS